ncbi:hypothetical protein D9758_018356 [Tetrapyrgos nigripes]|uniref:Uncharacterized protein n=1 Tax=Tetrapyrgos nigripes TaxID=182062 RepID=A0A8H5BIA1_9AGAR|nr:hypothetical protein D9758_018356 [Tetrapyrgos nigripes]
MTVTEINPRLIFRCYVIWGHRKTVLIGAISISILDNVTSITGIALTLTAGEELTPGTPPHNFLIAYLFINLAVNLTLSGLIVGRIWTIQRTARQILGERINKTYSSAIAITRTSIRAGLGVSTDNLQDTLSSFGRSCGQDQDSDFTSMVETLGDPTAQMVECGSQSRESRSLKQ